MVTIWKRCPSCETKWYFDDAHQASSDVDLEVCSWCGARLDPQAFFTPRMEDEDPDGLD